MSLAASPPSRVTILVSFERPHSSKTLSRMGMQVHRIWDKTGLSMELRDRDEVPPGTEFGNLVVFTLKGQCSMKPLPIGAISDERGPLAMAYSSDGKVLPFGSVECNKVRSSLERVLGRQNTGAFQAAFDSALGKVMAHELYHILAGTPVHTRGGLSKSALSANELLDDRLELPEATRLAIREPASINP